MGRLDPYPRRRHCWGMVYDIAIIGAGIAGASLAAELAPHMSVVLLEAEAHPGYHATGRSAAFWSVTYGGPLVEPLSTASGPFLAAPPRDFSETGFLKPRGALMLGRAKDEAGIAAFLRAFDGSDVPLERWGAAEVRARLRGNHPLWDRGVWEPGTADIDVAALHQAYLRAARRGGVAFLNHARVEQLSRGNGVWHVAWREGDVRARRVVNAAGAWADAVAGLAGVPPAGVTPFRRTIVQLQVAADVPADLPLVVDINERFYFKPEGPDRIWLSPHDETPSPACDVAPEELDIAEAIARFQTVMDWPIARLERSWAGLRSFAPDRLPIFGEDPAAPGFFWCAGQGGFGIQTAPAIAALLAAEILQEAPSGAYARLDPTAYGRGRARLVQKR